MCLFVFHVPFEGLSQEDIAAVPLETDVPMTAFNSAATPESHTTGKSHIKYSTVFNTVHGQKATCSLVVPPLFHAERLHFSLRVTNRRNTHFPFGYFTSNSFFGKSS